jgi:hypothetical protein
MPNMIEPCAIHFDDLDNTLTGTFHLLSCGHVVAIHDPETRCGRNCPHAVAFTFDKG